MPILFPRHISHYQVTIGSNYPAISVGFFDAINFKACGKSDSLGLESNVERDSVILKNAMLHPQNDMIFEVDK